MITKIDPTLVSMKDVSLQHLLDYAIPDEEGIFYNRHDMDVSHFIESLMAGLPLGVFLGSFLTEEQKEAYTGKLYVVHSLGDYRIQYLRWFLDGTATLKHTYTPMHINKTINTISSAERKAIFDRRVTLVLLDASLTGRSEFDDYQDILLGLYAN